MHVHKSNVLPFSKNLKKLGLENNLDQLRLPEYGALQDIIHDLFAKKKDDFNSQSVTRAKLMKVEYASLACGDGENKGIDFNKFSTPTAILNLVDSTAFPTKNVDSDIEKRRKEGNNMYPNRLHILTECVVEEILNENNQAYGLLTSRGTIV